MILRFMREGVRVGTWTGGQAVPRQGESVVLRHHEEHVQYHVAAVRWTAPDAAEVLLTDPRPVMP